MPKRWRPKKQEHSTMLMLDPMYVSTRASLQQHASQMQQIQPVVSDEAQCLQRHAKRTQKHEPRNARSAENATDDKGIRRRLTSHAHWFEQPLQRILQGQLENSVTVEGDLVHVR